MLCALRVRRGLNLLSEGEVVVSDRLHGVILGLLAGIPVVAIDNRIGKLSAFIRTWLLDCSGVVLAADLDEARHHVARLTRR
jgi:pyruvyl transferase EpsO